MFTNQPVKETFIFSETIAWDTAGPGITRKMFGYDDAMMMLCVRFEKGAVGSLHSHMHRQVCYVESGSFEITIDGDTKTLHRGDSFFVAPNLVHGAVALEAGTLIDVFTPAREDYI